MLDGTGPLIGFILSIFFLFFLISVDTAYGFVAKSLITRLKYPAVS